MRPQLVICEEFNKANAFNRENLCNSKKLFEGTGAPVQVNLYKSHQTKYEQTVFILAANTLPNFEGTGFSQNEF